MSTKKKYNDPIIEKKGITTTPYRGNLMSAETERRMKEIAGWIIRGYSDQKCWERGCQEWGISLDLIKRIVREAHKYITPEDYEEYCADLRAANFNRLLDLYERAINEGKLKVAREIIDSMNKLGNFYDQKITANVNMETKFQFGGLDDPDVDNVDNG